MTKVKLISKTRSNFLENSIKNSIKENNNFAEMVLKSNSATKIAATNLPNQPPTKIDIKTGWKVLKPKLNPYKEEVLLLKNDILLKDAEIKNLKIKLGVVKTNIDQFSYVASHDLKEPLRMVTSYLSLLKNKFGAQLDNKANTYIDLAIDGGARLHTMFNSLLDLSQIGRIEECKRIIPFNEIIDEVKINLSKKIKNVNAQINIEGEMPVLEVYERSIIRLVENLLINAMKFIKVGEAPIVKISAIEKDTSWEFCIADNGLGLDSISYKQIFAVFFKLHNSSLYEGNGIGLAICKKAVEQHGGAIWVTAKVNKGSKFYFSLSK